MPAIGDSFAGQWNWLDPPFLISLPVGFAHPRGNPFALERHPLFEKPLSMRHAATECLFYFVQFWLRPRLLRPLAH